jgi:hypothetical protein
MRRATNFETAGWAIIRAGRRISDEKVISGSGGLENADIAEG